MQTQSVTNSRPTYRGKVQEPVVDHYADPVDISAIWNDEVDPGEDATVAVYFDHNWDGDQFNPSIAGMSFTDGGDTIYYRAAGAMDNLGLEIVMRLEKAYSDEVNQ